MPSLNMNFCLNSCFQMIASQMKLSIEINHLKTHLAGLKMPRQLTIAHDQWTCLFVQDLRKQLMGYDIGSKLMPVRQCKTP